MGKKIKNRKGNARTQMRGKPMIQKQRWSVVETVLGEPKAQDCKKVPNINDWAPVKKQGEQND